MKNKSLEKIGGIGVGFEGPMAARRLAEFSEEKGCALSKDKEIFAGIWSNSKMVPCIGCGHSYNCQLLVVFYLADQKRKENPVRIQTEINAKIAEKLGISKRQVSKRRKRGEYI